MLSRELFADALQAAADDPSPLRDRGHAASVADLCLRLFETQAEVAAEIHRCGGSGPSSTLPDEDVPDIRMYDATEHTVARLTDTPARPLSVLAVARRMERAS